MTPHPVDTEEARFGAEAHLRYGGGGDDLAENVLALLDALAAADARATRAEAQAAIRGRAVAIYQQRAREAEARIKAVQELHQQSALIRRIPRSMREGHDDDQPFHYCTGCDGARYPCDTIRALDATATQETR